MHERSVYVVGDDPAVLSMFREEGFTVYGDEEALNPELAIDLVCFTGGADVCPDLYGEVNTSSFCDPDRDNFEVNVYNRFVKDQVPFVGICRGGQLLNVLNGGKMKQHVEGHSMGYRSATSEVQAWLDDLPDALFHGDHHQAILPHSSASILYTDTIDGVVKVCVYLKTRSLCFQPHPEWGHEETRSVFFDLVEGLFF